MIINGGQLTPSSSGVMDLSVLERQRVALKWNQDHLQLPQQQQAYFGDFSMLPVDTQHNFQGGLQVGAGSRPIKPDPGLMEPGSGSGSGWTDYASTTTRTVSCPPGDAKESLRKRKAELNTFLPPKAETESESRAKKVKHSCKEDGLTHKKADQINNSKCKEASEAQKLDYIHVRARRGQATDSHSLAERVRREKISERMNYLQDLVPGCNKITGKAGMLDEIINYVQSLQRQVEFLSMKLVAGNPMLDFDLQDLYVKEVFQACSSEFPASEITSEVANLAYLDFDQFGMSQVEMGFGGSISAPVSIPRAFHDSSCLTQNQTYLPWDQSDVQTIYNMDFQQARQQSLPSQKHTGVHFAVSSPSEQQ